MDRFTKGFFPSKLKAARKELGLTLTEFALKVGVTASHVSQMEKGRSFPSEKVLDSIIIAHGIRRDFLTLGEGEALFEFKYEKILS